MSFLKNNKGVVFLGIIVALCIILGVVGNVNLNKKVDSAYNTPKNTRGTASGDAPEYTRTVDGQGNVDTTEQQSEEDQQRAEENEAQADEDVSSNSAGNDESVQKKSETEEQKEEKEKGYYIEDGDIVTTVPEDELTLGGEVD